MKTIPVTRRAAVARFKRRLAKEGRQLRILKRPIDSVYRYTIVDANSIIAMTDVDGFIAWLRKDGILKPYEVVDIACSSTRRARYPNTSAAPSSTMRKNAPNLSA